MLRRGLTLLASLWLAGCAPPANTPGGMAGVAAPPKGARLYDGSCSGCHQPRGQGMPNVYPSLAGSPIVLGDPAVLARWIVKSQRPASMPAGRYAAKMPGFDWLRDEDAAALLTYLRANFGNSAPAVDAAAVAAALATG